MVVHCTNGLPSVAVVVGSALICLAAACTDGHRHHPENSPHFRMRRSFRTSSSVTDICDRHFGYKMADISLHIKPSLLYDTSNERYF